MIKKRIIPVQLLINNRLVKTVKFDSYRDVGNPVSSSKVYCNQDTDELVFLNINREKREVDELIPLIKQVSAVVFMPLAVGGGINCIEDVDKLIRNGADKIIINSICYKKPELITEIAQKYGRQAVVVSIDVRLNPKTEEYELYSDCGRKLEPISLKDHVEKVTKLGAGEIFINSIDRDGMMNGYDIPLIQDVMEATSIPVIACGGSGTIEQLKDAFVETDVSALGCGSIFNFGDNNPIRAKAFLTNYDLKFKIR